MAAASRRSIWRAGAKNDLISRGSPCREALLALKLHFWHGTTPGS
ncbi:MAG: hypothetical protein PHD34_01155 [Methanothrix soehngenii]|nr:hypothetical protein [Methanothrix soehngenii]